jgi:histone-binding protein RBBP4
LLTGEYLTALGYIGADTPNRDVNAYKKDAAGLQPLAKYTGHSAYVGDVDWHPEHDYMFASVGDDRKLMM